MGYNHILRRIVAVAIISLHRDEITAFVPTPTASSVRVATTVRQQHSQHDDSNAFLVDWTSRLQHRIAQALGAAALFAAVLTTPIFIHATSMSAHHCDISIEHSQAFAITENQQFIADIWFAVSAQYFDPTYNGLGEDGWRAKEQEALRVVANTGPDDIDAVENAIKIMLSALNDPYTRYLPKEKYAALTAYATNTLDEGGGGIGVQLLEDQRAKKVTILGTTSGGPADVAGLQSGDVIIKIDGVDVSESSAELVAAKCRGMPGDKVDVDFLRPDDDVGKPRHVTLTRTKILSNNDIQSTTFVSSLGGKTIGLIKIPSFTTDTIRQLVNELRTMTSKSSIDALAIDIRGNVGGYMPAGVDAAKLFLPARAHIIAEVGQSSSSIKTYDADGIGAELSLPMYILVDARTASASEIFASALQDNHRAVIVGTTNTFGKGRIQNVQPLQGGSGIAVTRARYITPSGRDLQGVGISPDTRPERCDARESARTCLANIV